MDTNFGDTYTTEKRMVGLHKKQLRKSTKNLFYIVLVVGIIVGLFYADKALNTATDNYINYQVQQQLSK